MMTVIWFLLGVIVWGVILSWLMLHTPTEWQPGTQKPFAPGFYERQYSDDEKVYDPFDYWDGERWRYHPSGPICILQKRQWR
jgi:hypothetical protein